MLVFIFIIKLLLVSGMLPMLLKDHDCGMFVFHIRDEGSGMWDNSQYR